MSKIISRRKKEKVTLLTRIALATRRIGACVSSLPSQYSIALGWGALTLIPLVQGGR